MIAFLIKVLSGAACAIDFVQGNLDLFLTDMGGLMASIWYINNGGNGYMNFELIYISSKNMVSKWWM